MAPRREVSANCEHCRKHGDHTMAANEPDYGTAAWARRHGTDPKDGSEVDTTRDVNHSLLMRDIRVTRHHHGERPIAWDCETSRNMRLANFADTLTRGRLPSEWHDDDGDVLWWRIIGKHQPGEPPYVGRPSDDEWPYDTYDETHPLIMWTPLPPYPVLRPEVKP